MLGHLYARRHLDRRYWDGSHIPLHSRILQKIIPGRRYKAVLADLAEFIESDGVWAKGVKATGYRLRAPLADAPFRIHWLDHPELVRNLARRREHEAAKYAPIHHYLRSMLGGLQVVGDTRRVLDGLEMGDDWPKVYLPLVAIGLGDHRFAVCEQGRVHTLLTNLPRRYRHHICWKGQPLWMTDIKNSQPLILAMTMKDAEREETKPKKGREREGGKESHSKGVSSSDGRPTDTERFLADCLAGRLYERLVQVTGLTRDALKKPFMSVLYGGRLDMETQVGIAFRDLYPTCFSAIQAMKPVQHRRRKGEPNIHDPALGALPRRMQRLEADLVIGQVCERLRREAPEACLLTVHDCLVTTEEYIPLFVRVLREEFQKTYGVTVPLHVKPFAED